MIGRFFQLEKNKTTIRTEVFAGLATFLTMAYIIFVQPAALSGVMFGFETGMDFNSIMVATCVAAALTSLLMALLTNYPIALAPGMGLNFFMVFSAMPAAEKAGFDEPWAVALGCVFLSGIIFIILSLLRIREMVLNAISPSVKNAIAVGIGLFIAFIGLQASGLITGSEGTLVDLTSDLASLDLLVFFFGLIVTAALMTRGHRWGILVGILSSTVFTIILFLLFRETDSPALQQSRLLNNFQFDLSIVSLPPSIAPTFLKMDLLAAIAPAMLPYIVVFLFVDLFDSMGTLIGVTQQAGIMKDGYLPKANEAFLTDAVGTTAGAILGTSTVTAFIESSAGVEQGGRTGLTAFTVGCLFLLALFFSPLIAMVGSYAAITAPALVFVGAMMLRNIVHVDFRDASEALPAFLIIVGIPFTYSIADGIALGLIAYPIIKLFAGKGREVNPLLYALTALFILYYLTVRAGLQ